MRQQLSGYGATGVGLLLALSGLVFLGCGKEADTASATKVAPKSASPVSRPRFDGRRFEVAAPPKEMKPLNAVLEDKVILLGYTLDKEVALPGATVTVTWYWKCVKAMSHQWEYFTHLLDAQGNHVSGLNSVGNTRSVFKPQMWRPGTIIRDVERIAIPADWRSSTIELRTGLWRGSVRMAVRKGPVDEENRVRGPVIAVQTMAANAHQSPVHERAVPFVQKAPVIDGALADDPAWDNALKLDPFVDTLTGRPAPATTEVRLMWDNRALYVAITALDKEMASPFTKPDEELWRGDAVDLFFDPLADGKDYVEFQVAPSGLFTDIRYGAYREADVAWQSGARVEVVANGTVNDTAGEDESWQVEMAIPLSVFTGAVKPAPETGFVLGANVYRIDRQGPTTTYTGWNAPMRGDFHAFDRFGKLTLTKP